METDLWPRILAAIEQQTTSATFEYLLRGAQGVIEDDVLTIQLETETAVEWVDARMMPLIERTAARLAGRRLIVEVGTQPVAPDTAAAVAQEPEVSVELLRLNPQQFGFVKVSNYAVRFWQPYLGVQPFALWITLRSFAYTANRAVWPSIQTLADICSGGNRHALLGRAARGSRAAQEGALTVLETERIIRVVRRGAGTGMAYSFRVVDPLPLLTPFQVERLALGLRLAHERFVKKISVDLELWRGVGLESLVPP